jgi:hypothetical protein
LNSCGRLPIILSSGFGAGGFPPAGIAGAGAGAPGPPGFRVPPDPPGALHMAVRKLLAILCDAEVVDVVVVVAGGVPGQTVVIAAVAVVVVVAIFAAVSCCSW